MQEKDKNDIMQEAKILESLNHPNIIHFKELIIDNQNEYLHIVMEYADGGDMNQKIKMQKGKHFTETQILNWFSQICQAIKYLHETKKIIHRDIKSSNIFLTRTNQIKLGDFGIAKCLNKSMGKAYTVVGTPYYLSPEIINNEPYDFKSDIWALGILLYEMCMLKLPFDSNNIAQLYIKIIKGVYQPISGEYSKELKLLIGSMLRVNSIKRPKIMDIINNQIIKDNSNPPLTRKRGNSDLYRPKNESAKNFGKFINCSIRRNTKVKIEEVKAQKTVKENEKKNNIVINQSIFDNFRKGKNAILEEFMKNKQEKIKHSNIISKSISDNLWSKNYSLFTNNENKENNTDNTHFEIIENDNINNNKFINEIDILTSFKFDSSKELTDEGKEESSPKVENDDKVIHIDNLNLLPSDYVNEEIKEEEENEVTIERSIEIEKNEEKEEVIQIDLDIPKNNSIHPLSENEIQASIKEDMILKLGENFVEDLISFLHQNVSPDIQDYNYDKLINMLQNKFSNIYPKSKIDNAIKCIPDIQFLLISSQQM